MCDIQPAERHRDLTAAILGNGWLALYHILTSQYPPVARAVLGHQYFPISCLTGRVVQKAGGGGRPGEEVGVGAPVWHFAGKTLWRLK